MKGAICRKLRYQLYIKNQLSNEWQAASKYPKLQLIAEFLDISYPTVHNIYNNKSNKYGKFYKIEKII
jgi:hypothetical protein